MGHLLSKLGLVALLGLAVAACGNSADQEAADTKSTATTSSVPAAKAPKLGLMTSLPLYWPLDADMTQIASGEAQVPWQREFLERRFQLEPLDTLSPIPGLAPDDPETDPLANLDYLAVIQPRGLSPADNVALDDWVRGGGTLLLALDPQLTGDYELPVGDPRRPVDTALILPIVERWGLRMGFRVYERWEDGIFEVPLGNTSFMVSHGGEFEIADPEAADCELLAKNVVAQCAIGEGRAFLIADAALFENIALAGFEGEKLLTVLAAAFSGKESGKSREMSASRGEADAD